MIAAAIAASAAPLQAQRYSCAQADSLLLSDGGARRDLFSATNTTLSASCRDGAAAVITRLLRRAGQNTVRDTLARDAARMLHRDESMMDSLIALAKDSTQSADRRTFYMKLLVVHADCNARADDSPGYESRWSVAIAGSFLACVGEFRHPISAAVRGRAREGIAWMGAHDPDTRLRELSRRVAEELVRNPQYRNPFDR